MQIICLIFIPWIVFGILSWLKLFNVWINIGISFVTEMIYFAIIYVVDILIDDGDNNLEKVIERAKKIIG